MRLIRMVSAATAAASLAAAVAAASDLYVFEYRALFQLFGWPGLSIAAVAVITLIVISVQEYRAATDRPAWRSGWTRATALTGATVLAWVAQHIFMQDPLTGRLQDWVRQIAGERSSVTAAVPPDLAAFSLYRRARSETDRLALKAMYQRIQINSPAAYALHPTAITIDRYASQFGVDPAILFFLNYIDSFYGEAEAGPLPFARLMTPETFRDLVQIHLPSWFVESSVRRKLVGAHGVEGNLGDSVAFKLRYAIHKATLDVSTQPYALNTYTDIFLVLREFPAAFPELREAAGGDPLRQALASSFAALRETAMVSPYEDPWSVAPYQQSYYDQHRDALKRFARAAFYLAVIDFDFATRIQALLTRYQANYFERRIGPDRWNQLPDWQRAAMLVMIRDLYTPGVGRIGFNVYAIPEINCTPLAFVASEAATAFATQPPGRSLWKPRHDEYLWGGARYRLRVFNEIWEIARGAPIPGLGVETTTEEADRIVSRWMSRAN